MSRAEALHRHQRRALACPLARFQVLVCGNRDWCCCAEGKSLEQIRQPDPSGALGSPVCLGSNHRPLLLIGMALSTTEMKRGKDGACV